MGILPNCSSDNTIIWLQNLVFKKPLGEKAQWELCKDGAYCFEKILEAVPNKKAVVQPLSSHFPNYPNILKTY